MIVQISKNECVFLDPVLDGVREKVFLSPLFSVYSCALLRDILLQGRLYISRNWLCFYANLFGKDIKVRMTDRQLNKLKLTDKLEPSSHNLTSWLDDLTNYLTESHSGFWADSQCHGPNSPAQKMSVSSCLHCEIMCREQVDLLNL